MYIIDTDILTSELLTKYHQDELTKKYLAFYRKIPLMKRVLPDFVLTEFELFITKVMPTRYAMQVSEKKRLHDVVASYLRQINNNCILVSPNQQTMQHALALYQQRTELYEQASLTDCLLLASAQQLSYTILSKDKRVMAYATELHIPFVTITA